jgi:hypothetical protein
LGCQVVASAHFTQKGISAMPCEHAGEKDTAGSAAFEAPEQLVERSRRRVFLLLGTAAAAVSALLFAQEVTDGLRIVEYSDESEHFVVAQMILNGGHLYRDIFSHHGPFPYLLAHLYALIVDPSDFSHIRLIPALLALASGAALVCSPVFSHLSARLCAGAIYLGLLSALWIVEGFNFFHFMPLSGYLFVIVVAHLVIPTLLQRTPTTAGLFISGLAAAWACFCGYSNGPAIVLFSIAALVATSTSFSDRRALVSYWSPFVLGASLASFLVTAWLLKFGDIEGFLIYHFYFNQKVYASFIGFSLLDVLRNLTLSLQPGTIIHTFSLTMLGSWLAIFAFLGRSGSPRTVPASYLLGLALAAIATLFSNPRGYLIAVVDCPFVAVNACVFSVALAVVLERGVSVPASSRWLATLAVGLAIGAILLSLSIGRYATSWIGGHRRDMINYASIMSVEDSALYDFIRSITKEHADFLAINGTTSLYVKAGRTPASGNFFYTPWQASYGKAPIDGYHIDICADIGKQKPAVIYFFNWRVFDRWSIDDYEPCVVSLISTGYIPLRFDSPWHIRKDLWHTAAGRVPRDVGMHLDPWVQSQLGDGDPPILKPSHRLSPSSAIAIRMAPTHLERSLRLKRIGLLFSIRGAHRTGQGELQLTGPAGAKVFKRFDLSELSDNRYHYFDVPPDRYTNGLILSATGNGISIWESDLGIAYTCSIYEYTDGTRAFTPACPIQ